MRIQLPRLASNAVAFYCDADPDCRTPELIARTPLGTNALIVTDDEIELFTTPFDLAFAFALQLGARIGADPLHYPNVEDLIEKYRVVAGVQEDAA